MLRWTRRRIEEKDEAIAQMLEKSDEMRALVDQLLLIARLDAGQAPMEERVDLSSLMEEIALDMEPVAQERNITIETDFQPAFVRGNRALLTRAVINLGRRRWWRRWRRRRERQ